MVERPVKFKLFDPSGGKPVEMDILMDGDPLAVAHAVEWETLKPRTDLYRIYVKRIGVSFGPFYTSPGLAFKGLRHVLKGFPKAIWTEKAEWYANQKWLLDWIEKNLGKTNDLIGGEWLRE